MKSKFVNVESFTYSSIPVLYLIYCFSFPSHETGEPLQELFPELLPIEIPFLIGAIKNPKTIPKKKKAAHLKNNRVLFMSTPFLQLVNVLYSD